jgi:hypothetical protein
MPRMMYITKIAMRRRTIIAFTVSINWALDPAGAPTTEGGMISFIDIPSHPKHAPHEPDTTEQASKSGT